SHDYRATTSLLSSPTRRSSALRAAAGESGGPRLRVDQGELARLAQRRVPRLRAVLHDDARGPVDVRVRVPVAVHGAPSVVVKDGERKSTRLNSSHVASSYAVFC